MKYLALAVLLCVMQTSPPAPRKADDSSAGARGSVQHQTNSIKEPPATPSSLGQAPSHDAAGNEQGAKDAEHSISIGKLPPVTIASPKRDWADWGIWVFTFLLAATSVLQIWLLRRTLTYVRRQAHEMRHQRHEMWRQRKAMVEQVEIANRSLVAQFRPTIVVRSIKLNPSSTSEFDRYGEGNWTIDLYIVNVGQTEAHIKHCEATGFWRDGYPPTATQIGKAQWPEFSVQAGGRRKLNLPIEVENFRGNMSVLEHDAKRNRQDAWPICSGKIIYRDDSGCIRETGFERVWQVGTQKFIASEDPELEYHD